MRSGLDADEAVAVLERAGLWPVVGEDDAAVWQVVDACRDLASGLDALRVLADLAQAHPAAFEDLCSDPAWLARVAAVAGTSGPLGRLLAQDTSALRALERPDAVRADQIADVVRLAVAQAWPAAADAASGTTIDGPARAVATIRRHVTATIAGRDLTGDVAVDEVAAELADLAEGVLRGTLAAVHAKLAGAEPAARVAVIGMGKLGGRELNYVSDVDVVFVHEPVDEGPDAEARATAEATAVLTAVLGILNASTTMGRAYEVDPTLRPEGRHGALSRTLAGYEVYWDSWARTWEFQALLKARPVAGDRSLGDRFVASAHRRVWPEHLDPGVIAEIRSMKARVEAKPEVRRDGERQVKLGPGGLRDIEFAVQLLQLVHGRHDRRLRTTGTVQALTALATGGYVADEDASAFVDAYRHLRLVEHRLQLANERRTHTIPEREDRQDWLARSVGHRSSAGAPAREPFLRELRQVQATVRDLHTKLFYRPLLEVHAAVPASDGQLSLPGQVRAMGAPAAQERLRALGFQDPVAALRHIGTITAGLSRRARAVRAALPAMLHRLADTPDPDSGLRALAQVLEAHGPGGVLPARLRDHPPTADLVAAVLGTSPVAAELLAAQPDAVDWLLAADLRTSPRDRDELERRLQLRAGWQERGAALRHLKRAELLRVILRDLGGWTDQAGVGLELTALGEACLEVGLRAAVQQQLEQDGLDEPPAAIAVVGMGKLGGHELHYCSDLDVLFVHEPMPDADPDLAGRFAVGVAEHVLRSLSAITAEGTAFEVDADLRPEGRRGPLSRSLRAYEAYYRRWSDPWEHQALLRARPVAGDDEVGERFAELVEPLAAPPELDAQLVGHLRKLKARLERERLPRRADPSRHLKMGPGGIADVEWTVQLLQLRHGSAHPEVLQPGTMQALDRLLQAGLVEDGDATVLRDAYEFLTLVRNRLYLRRARSVDELPRAGAGGTDAVARSMGYDRDDWQGFEDDHARHRRRARAVCERLFYGMAPGEVTT